jgi:hypothetical protein
MVPLQATADGRLKLPVWSWRSEGLVDREDAVLDGHARAEKVESVHHFIAREFPLDQITEFIELFSGNTRLAGDFVVVKVGHRSAFSS